jgi:hypothetical protein
LLKISGILGVKITDFFEGTDRPHDTVRRTLLLRGVIPECRIGPDQKPRCNSQPPNAQQVCG